MDHNFDYLFLESGSASTFKRPDVTITIPLLATATLLCIQLLHGLTNHLTTQHAHDIHDEQNGASSFLTTQDRIQSRIKVFGGLHIFIYAVARLVGCLVLLGLSCITLVKPSELIHTHSLPSEPFTRVFIEYEEFFVPTAFAYSSVLAFLSLAVKRWSTPATRYNIVLLLVIFGVYAYRDLWPLATFSQRPKDESEGPILWLKIVILFLTAVLIPLFVPRPYKPIDPEDPVTATNDEQTCSLISLIVFTYLDPVIFLGSRVSHIGFGQLPPLSDTDSSKNLVKKAFPYLDPVYNKRSNLLYGLLRIFRTPYILSAFLLVAQAVAYFASPIGLYHILSYLETDGRGANSDIRPWFWIMCMVIGPTIRSLTFHWYSFINTKTLIRGEAILIQLLFEHSLRIRVQVDSTNEENDRADVQESSSQDDTPEVRTAESTTNSSHRSVGKGEQNPILDTALSLKSSNSSQSLNSSTSIAKAAETRPGEQDDKHNFAGKMNNLVTTDLKNILEARDFLTLILFVPVHISLCIIFLYQILGWSAIVGFLAMILLSPILGYIAKRTQDAQNARIKITDARVQKITEAVSVIRMVKMFGWEQRIADQIKAKRDDEVTWLRKITILEITGGITNHIIPILTMVVSYATFTVIMKQDLTASKIFSSISVFSMLRAQLQRVASQSTAIIQGKVSIDRMNNFLQNSELLDTVISTTIAVTPQASDIDQQVIGFNKATFTWSLGSANPCLMRSVSSRTFRLWIDERLTFKPNVINLIIGPTGSGKTSMLMALLGEMHFVRSTTDSWFGLPRDGGVAYAAQEAWIQNDTIRGNIIFGTAYDAVRYKRVIYQCALERDLQLFDAGDQTEVGEKGLTLSGGQKARVTLARAVYSRAKILLLDDVLAALDVHTSAWIINKCFRGDLIQGRTVLLVTHNLALAAPIASLIVTIAKDGTISVEDSSNGNNPPVHALQAIAAKLTEPDTLMISNEDVDSPPKVSASTDGKLTVAEEITEGHITWKSLKLFLRALGGDYRLVFFSLWLSGFLLTDWVNTFQVWFLGYWGSQYENHPASEVKAGYYLGQYTSVLFVMTAVYSTTFVFYILGMMRASRIINNVLVESILGSTLRWLDKTPSARIIARCTQDITAVDGAIPRAFSAITESTISVLTKVGIIIVFAPVLLAPGLAVTGLCFYLGNVYLKAQLSVKREMSNARSPILAHFSAAITGLVSIRAYGAQRSFKKESLNRIDHYVRIARISYNLNRWFGLRIDVLGALFTSSLASYLVYGGRPLGAGDAGFSLNMCIDFCTLVMWWVRIFNDLEVQANSLERIQQYIDIEHEPKSTEAGMPPASWPTSGKLRVENLSARYSQTGPIVLHDLSFSIKSGERIGVVGRTGSGKSSLTLSLLRCIVTEGTVYYDEIPTNTLNLDALRSNITIIPQTPELLSGTLRRNLDPFEQYDDAVLNDALHDAGLFALQEDVEGARITLDSDIASGGTNLSIGQRQILALARAMVRGSKLLILDEATSSIDYKTDAMIQATLRHRLASDVTVITVAHRLQTIMDSDRIMVLDAGRIVEFDTPTALLQNEHGMLKALVDGSGDKSTLYSMAEGSMTISSAYDTLP